MSWARPLDDEPEKPHLRVERWGYVIIGLATAATSIAVGVLEIRRARAEAEKARAEAEKARAEAEKAREP